MRISLIVFALIAVCPALVAQQAPAGPATPAAAKPRATQPPAPDGPPSPDQVLKLLELLRVRDELQITLDAMKQQVKAGAIQTFGEKIPDPTPEQLKSVNGVVDEVFGDLSLDELIRDLVPVYQRHLTRSDVRALIAFYSSAPGQKILREQPAMMQESMKVAGVSQQKRMEGLLAKLDLRMQQLIDQEQNKPAPNKK